MAWQYETTTWQALCEVAEVKPDNCTWVEVTFRTGIVLSKDCQRRIDRVMQGPFDGALHGDRIASASLFFEKDRDPNMAVRESNRHLCRQA